MPHRHPGRPLKYFLLLLLGVACRLTAGAQTAADTLPAPPPAVQAPTADSTVVPPPVKKKLRLRLDSTGKVITDSAGIRRYDSLRRIRLRTGDSLRRARASQAADSTGHPVSPDRAADTTTGITDGPPANTLAPAYSASRPGAYRPPASGWMNYLGTDPFFAFLKPPVRVRDDRHYARSYDGLFYLLVAMGFFFAIVKLAFGKYLGNLLTLFFRVSMRQQQIREQVLQFPFPSLLLNVLFLLSGGLFSTFLFRQYQYAPPDHFWRTYVLCIAFLALLYLMKFILLKLSGWIFNIPRAVETYLFIVFMTNKIIGIFLLPFVVILSFADAGVAPVALTVATVMILVFYGYRVAGTFASLRKEIKFSRIHFLLYLCAFEIAPVLLIYKVLLTNIDKAF